MAIIFNIIAKYGNPKKESYMPKGNEDHHTSKKKSKFTLKERRQMKREKKHKENHIPSSDINY